MIRLRLNGKWFENFTTLNVDLKLNTIASTFSFTGFDQFFNILRYEDCEIYFNDEKLLTGTVLNPAFKYTNKPNLVGVSGYSKSGILEDVNYPPELYPTQFDNLSLKEIAQKMCNYFGLKLKVFDNAEKDASIKFEKTSIGETESIRSYLAKLSSQRGIILAHDNYARLLLYKAEAKVKPRLTLKFEDALNNTFSPNSQVLHSEITGMIQAKSDNNNNQQLTVKSPFITNIKRPKVIVIEEGDDLQATVNKAICAEARAFGFTLTYEGLLDFRSGFYVNLDAPILKETTKFIIENVLFSAKDNRSTTTLNLVLPCVYTGILPSSNPFKS